MAVADHTTTPTAPAAAVAAGGGCGWVLCPAAPPDRGPGGEPGGERADGDPPGLVVRMPADELAELLGHADAITIGPATLLRRMGLTGVRTTRAAAVSARQLVAGAVAALGRDLPVTLSSQLRVKAAESVMRWLLARAAVVPLPAPGERSGVWVIGMDDGTRVEVTATAGGVRIAGEREYSAREWRALAAAGLAAAGLNNSSSSNGRENRG